jgi:hypothetical protein
MVNLEEHQVAITLEQAENVSIIVAESIRRGLGPRAATIALVTAWQESGLRNLDYGDLDSIGLFQQRPSQGWGTVEQILDPWYSAGKFYEVLITIDNWDERDITEVAQAVQRSAYPDAYRQHEWKGRVWASSLRGWSSESLTCRVHQSITGSTANISSFLTRTYGSALPITINANSITLSAPNELEAWAIAQLALARIGVDGVSAVQVGNRQWVHDPWDWGLWIDTDSAAAPNPKTTVIITLNP